MVWWRVRALLSSRPGADRIPTDAGRIRHRAAGAVGRRKCNRQCRFRRGCISRLWALVGLMGIATAFIILSFYSVIGGWAIAHAVDTATRGIAGLNARAAQLRFDALMAGG
jgi:SNF family Na+-dependent transporter